MNKAGSIIFFLALILAFHSCAKRGNPEGGPIDIEPPRFVRASPENYSTNFDAEEIRIVFNEYIKLNEAQRQIIISPPMDPMPEITPLGTASKSIRIKINDTLQPNTTYTINFGRSIVDNNEGNPLDFFQYVFSTGSYIDSLTVAGVVTDAYLAAPEPFTTVMLYEVDSTYSDSVIYKETPRYITNTLDSTFFQLNNLKAGTYQMLAISDKNNNYKFDPKNEKIAFLKEFITVPKDTLYEMRLFREILPFATTRPSQAAQQRIMFGYTGQLDKDSIAIEMISSKPEGFTSRITKDPLKDTLNYWYKPLIENDSLIFVASAGDYLDTLITRRREMEKDSLNFTYDPSGTLSFNKDISILPNIPLQAVNDTLINLFKQDSVPVAFTTNYEPFENRVLIRFEKEENVNYRLQVLPGGLVDFFGTQNDTINKGFRTQAISDYGNVIASLSNVEQFPILVQLTNEKGEVQAQQKSTSATNFTFRFLKPGTYMLRVIYDTNENGIWDTGSYLEGNQPEEIIYFPEVIDVRANWDQTISFML
ncbi:Ig-like domain-containing protein [Salinimicrobium sp. GXAS 041]|uniref:Ig-like domain-containing protein n=1 Tax=Salinimicrobium sp. GXAS 041 TaxID=3400806 RepID=UPI003C713BA2